MHRVLGSAALVPILLLALAATVVAARPSTGFAGSWLATDPFDGSNLTAVITGDRSTQVVYTDDNATGACADADSPTFASLLVGKVDGNLMVTYMTHAKCGTAPLRLNGLEIEWYLDDGGNDDPADDVLTNSFGEEYTRG